MVKEGDKPSYLFNLQTEYILREAGLEDKHGFKIVEKNINTLQLTLLH